MDRLDKIKTLVERIVANNNDPLSDPNFDLETLADTKEKAFTLGIDQGSFDLAFSIKAILERTDDT